MIVYIIMLVLGVAAMYVQTYKENDLLMFLFLGAAWGVYYVFGGVA